MPNPSVKRDALKCAPTSNVMHQDKLSLLPLLLAISAPSFASSGLEPLPVADVLPIEGKTCGCVAFLDGQPLLPSAIVMSSGSYSGPHLVRLNGATVALDRIGPPKGKDTFANTYRSGSISIVTRTREVSYSHVCTSYPEPPSEGSCFTGTLTLRIGKELSSARIVQLCGC